MAEDEAIEREMRLLKEDYLRSLPAKLERLTVLHRTLSDGGGTQAVLDDYVFVVHKLAGSAALYGLEDVSDVAKRLENLLLTVSPGSPDLPAGLLNDLDSLMRDLLAAAPPGY